jgi:putative glycosyl hydrolase
VRHPIGRARVVAGTLRSHPRRVPRALLAPLFSVAVLTVLAGPAWARPTVGIADHNVSTFSDPHYRALGVRIARLVIPYDAVLNGGWERDQVDAWMAAATAAGVEPMVAFNHSRTAGKVPTVAEYRRHIQAFHARYPQVRVITPWNEANYKSQPTASNPRLAADFYNQTLSVFPGARIVAADVLDQDDVLTWLRTFRTYAYQHPQLWGLHNYNDVNLFRPAATSVTAKVLGYLPGEVWLTETGGIVNSPRFPYDLDRAARAVAHTFTLAEAFPRISRVYVYNWLGVANRTQWDAGLVDADGTPRPALDVVRRYLGRR